MYIVPFNVENIRNIAEAEGVPVPLSVYKLAIYYYILQYGDKDKKDSTTTNPTPGDTNSVKK